MPRLLTILAAVALASAAATPAFAETLIVTPGAAGSATPCTAAAPCALEWAMQNATAADTVLVVDGTYHLTATVDQHEGVLAAAPGAHPVVDGDGAVVFDGIAIRDLTLHPYDGLVLNRDAVAERLWIEHDGPDPAAYLNNSTTLRDSTVIEHGPAVAAIMAGATGTSAGGVHVEDVTAIADGDHGIAIDVASLGQPGGSCWNFPSTGVIRNTIARGGGADLRLRVNGPNPGCLPPAILDVATSNYRTVLVTEADATTVVAGPGNQTSPEQTADATVFAAHDLGYRQDPGSPTIDTGAADTQTGATDRDGDARTIGGRPDIGSDEMVGAPTLTTGPTQLPGSGTVAFGATAHSDSPVTVRFDVGTSNAYGTNVAAAPSPDGPGLFTATVSGFALNTLVHYRAIATATNGIQTRTTITPDATILVPLPSPAPPLPKPGTTTKPGTLPRLSAAAVIKLTAPARRCSSRRTLTLRLTAPKATKIVKATVTLRGKTTTYTGKRLKAKIDLRGLPKGKFTVKVAITLADGRSAKLTKSYKTCTKKQITKK
jgi:hypothetical protein